MVYLNYGELLYIIHSPVPLERTSHDSKTCVAISKFHNRITIEFYILQIFSANWLSEICFQLMTESKCQLYSTNN